MMGIEHSVPPSAMAISAYDSPYIGRFAPSPTGPLHFGSLVSALASYLDAKSHNGIWLVRMEDIDPPREMPGAADYILQQLQHHGLHWDGHVLYQSQRSDAYLSALQQLQDRGLTYHCHCTRQQIKKRGGIHSYRCQLENPAEPAALRLALPDQCNIQFNDLFQGQQTQDVKQQVGDLVLRRKDGLFAYQLAVVVDDAFQQITHIIRGSDLLETTPGQIYLQQRLNCTSPQYGHIPVATNLAGQKLSKQNLTPPINHETAAHNLARAMNWLGLPVMKDAKIVSSTSCDELLAWAVSNWQRKLVPPEMERVASD